MLGKITAGRCYIALDERAYIHGLAALREQDVADKVHHQDKVVQCCQSHPNLSAFTRFPSF